MKKRLLVLLMIMGVLLMIGCSKENEGKVMDAGTDKTSVSPDNTVSPKAPPTTGAEPSGPASPAVESPEPLKPDTGYLSEEMFNNAVMAEGNLARLAAVMKKASNGEAITVGVIGGSITQGSSSTYIENSYAYRFKEWWVQRFPNAKVNYVNAGIGATTSYLGVHRVDKQLLSYNPDVVVVEFSVNDSDSVFYKETYEDLVRKILKNSNNPAVILLFMTMEDGTSAQPSHMHIGFWYDLPRISYRQAVLKEMEKGTLEWKDISPDNIHPNDKGHAIAGEILWGYLNQVYAKLDTITESVTPLEKEPFFKESYADATVLDSETIVPFAMGSFEKSSVFDRFPNNWTTKGGNDAIVFEVEARNIGIMFYRTVDGMSGQFDVYVDGVYMRTLDANFKGGWGNFTETVEIFKGSEKQLHRIEIRKSEKSTGDVFTVVGLLIS
jgi:lysophospholipase L1-like esterase